MPGTTDGADGAQPRPTAPVPARAVILLIESLIHTLVRKAILSSAEAAELIEDALAIQAELHHEQDGEGAGDRSIEALLTAMVASLRLDLIPPTRPRSA